MITHNVVQGSQEWIDLHIGIPTTSGFDRLVMPAKRQASTQIAGYAQELAANHYAGKMLESWKGNKWTERGHEYEDSARAWYELMFEDRVVTQVGFIINDAGTAGSSPDSLVDDDGGLEIKCLGAKKHMKVIQDYHLTKKTPNDYFIQPQGQMLVAKRDWIDLLFYHPDLPALLIRQLPDFQVQGLLSTQIDTCIALRDTLIMVLEDLNNFPAG